MPSPLLDPVSSETPRYPHVAEPVVPRLPHSEWVSRQVQAMASAWSRGETVSADELLACYPGLDDEGAIRLIYEEISLRRESGQDVATTEVLNRFPRWKDELEILLGCDRMLRPFSRVARFPDVGEDLGPFRLLAELGRGASGKTYLAAEPALGNRLIVLKVITDDQEEHLSLARLRHTHIIPLFSEQSFPDRGLRALCMPYLGGASLARILEGVAMTPPGARRGRHILDVVDRMRTVAHAGPAMVDGPYRRFLGQASYVQSICWMAACLADALHSAHAHGLVHMDVKPSNVLIAGDGMPMLLDFHLAHRPIGAGELVTDRLGGTPGWMAPEHRAALDAVRHGETVPAPVDGRADLYSLGVLIREALSAPWDARDRSAGTSWRLRGPEVSVGLADIVARCLAASPADRYQDGAALADDLRRHLNELPLRGVANRSPVERWRKWRRRRPSALTRWAALLITCAAMVVAVLLAQAYHAQHVREIRNALDDGRRLGNDHQFPEAARAISRGLEIARAVPGVGQLRSSLSQQLTRVRRAQKAAALHELADSVRFRYGIDAPAPDEARTLFDSIRSIWQGADLLLGPVTQTLDSPSEQAIRTDLLDLTVAAVELRMGLAATGEADTARRDAIQLLDLAKSSCGNDGRLERLRRTAAGVPAEGDSADDFDPVDASVLGLYDRGRARLRAGRFREAAADFQRVVDERPQDFWPNFYQGLCAYRLGRFHDAMAAFGACIALAPGSAECYYNRARAEEALGRGDRALSDYDRALQLDPGLTAASINRGVLAYNSDKAAAAITDFKQALQSASDSRTVGRIHYNLALAYLAAGDRRSARASIQQALSHGHDAARLLTDRLDDLH